MPTRENYIPTIHDGLNFAPERYLFSGDGLVSCPTNQSYRKNAPGMFTTINLPSGTHHLKFVVDGEMVTSPDLPTAVDFNNFLVNYLEIATEDIAKPRRESAQPGAKSTTLVPEEQDQLRSGEQTPEDSDIEEPQAEEVPAGDFRQLVPPFLVDVDLSEDDDKYVRAVKVIQETGGPPTLPMFLSRSILNGILPVKDDNSVLTLPNHTVLNHLMTSSVKNGVLATSVTTRYKKKVRSPRCSSISFFVSLTDQ